MKRFNNSDQNSTTVLSTQCTFLAFGFSVEHRRWFSGEVSQAHRRRPLERVLRVEQGACKLSQPLETKSYPEHTATEG